MQGARDQRPWAQWFGRGEWIYPTALFLTCLVIFSSENYYQAGDTIPAELLPISILRHHTLTFEWFAAASDPQLPSWFKAVAGRTLSAYPLAPGLLNVPAFLIGAGLGLDLFESRFQLSLWTSSVIAALTAVLMYFCIKRVCVRPQSALLLAAAVTLGTCLWSVASRTLWQHGPGLLFLSAALLALGARKQSHIAWSGLFFGLAIATRSTNALLGIAAFAYVARHERGAAIRWLLMLAVPVTLLLVYSKLYYGSPFLLGQGQPFLDGFYGNVARGFAGLIVSPGRGMLIISPILIPGLIYLIRCLFGASSAHPMYQYLALGVVLLFLVSSRWANWWGGLSFGYRLIMEAIPVLAIFLAEAYNRMASRPTLRTIALTVLAIISLYNNFLGAYYAPCGGNNGVNENPGISWYVPRSEVIVCSQALLVDLQLRTPP